MNQTFKDVCRLLFKIECFQFSNQEISDELLKLVHEQQYNDVLKSQLILSFLKKYYKPVGQLYSFLMAANISIANGKPFAPFVIITIPLPNEGMPICQHVDAKWNGLKGYLTIPTNLKKK